ncbi:hypothetical protein PI124_g5245 [Phytophthora idaei]|nr:hypothetical protein PI125_g5972 [Phytophthora idaei]KAG3137520.1 hypothetical protein PI126_g17357 [Phytophthora idaei]KAG3250113.1 hypothetical protein PI124_g5245 [Phytophthora idaei]
MHQGAEVDALEWIGDAAEEQRACDVVEEVGREADVHREEDMAEACSSGGAETDLPQAGQVVSEPDNSGGVVPRRVERTTCYFKGYQYVRAWSS